MSKTISFPSSVLLNCELVSLALGLQQIASETQYKRQIDFIKGEVMGLTANETDRVNEADQEKKRKKKWLVLLLLLLLSILVGVLVFAPQGEDGKPVDSYDHPVMEDRGFGEDGQLDMTNAETIRYGVQQKADESMVRFKINTNPVYSNGEVNWMIENTAQNIGLVQVDVILDGEVVYESPTLKPNQKVQVGKVDLSHLDQGSYEATAVFNVYDPVTKYKVGNPAVKINLSINGG